MSKKKETQTKNLSRKRVNLLNKERLRNEKIYRKEKEKISNINAEIKNNQFKL